MYAKLCIFNNSHNNFLGLTIYGSHDIINPELRIKQINRSML